MARDCRLSSPRTGARAPSDSTTASTSNPYTCSTARRSTRSSTWSTTGRTTENRNVPAVETTSVGTTPSRSRCPATAARRTPTRNRLAHVVAAPPWEYRPRQRRIRLYGGSRTSSATLRTAYAMIGFAPAVCLYRQWGLRHSLYASSIAPMRGDSERNELRGEVCQSVRGSSVRALNSRCQGTIGSVVVVVEHARRPLARDRHLVSVRHGGRSSSPCPRISSSTGVRRTRSSGPNLVTRTSAATPVRRRTRPSSTPSPVRNFDVTGKSGWLYYTQFNPPDCNTLGTYDCDLRIPIELAIEPSR